ncbi:MAG: hypothetical protein PHR52_05165 [Fermentimonas sp.]|nr:hypothetical protein [Fermentimonas sp.]MDD4696905.1 hypothetical protein [Fermentimonas sp.]
MKGICFKEPLFHLTLQGIKKQTRRIIKPQPDNIRSFNRVLGNTPDYELSEKPWTPEPAYHFLMHEGKYLNPRYKAGDVVYLKEPYSWISLGSREPVTVYKYDNEEYDDEFGTSFLISKWQNKLFMPESAARYFIKITNVRAERLQDISEEDCIKEGIKVGRCGNESKWMKAFYVEGDNQPYITARRAYEMLINKINGKDTWQSNPWVWVYEYELTLNSKK